MCLSKSNKSITIHYVVVSDLVIIETFKRFFLVLMTLTWNLKRLWESFCFPIKVRKCRIFVVRTDTFRSMTFFSDSSLQETRFYAEKEDRVGNFMVSPNHYLNLINLSTCWINEADQNNVSQWLDFFCFFGLCGCQR